MRLGLGTAQLGLAYGVTNARGKISESEAVEILETAQRVGVSFLDTAPVYGCAESLIGRAKLGVLNSQVITKTSTRGGHSVPGRDALRENFLGSLRALDAARIEGLLLHDCTEALQSGGDALISEMQRIKADGLVEKIGISIYSSDEIDLLLGIFRPDIVQLPLNVLDQRLIRSGHLSRLIGMGIEVHARSAFLQGALLADPARLPDYLSPLADGIRGFQLSMQDHGLTPLEGSIAFLSSQPNIHALVIGVTSKAELLKIVQGLQKSKTMDGLDFSSFCRGVPEHLLNPGNWKSQSGTALGGRG